MLKPSEGQQLVMRDAEGALARLAAVQRSTEARRGWGAALGPTERTSRTPPNHETPSSVTGAPYGAARKVAGT